MPWCRKCQMEYDDPSATECADCQAPLAQEPPQKLPPRDLGQAVLLLKLDDQLEAEMLLNLLAERQIPAIKKIRGAGGYLSIYMGVTSMGVEIYVPQQLREQAWELVESIRLPEGVEGMPADADTLPMPDDCMPRSKDKEDGSAEVKKAPFLRRMGRVLLWLWLAGCVLAVLFQLAGVFGALTGLI